MPTRCPKRKPHPPPLHPPSRKRCGQRRHRPGRLRPCCATSPSAARSRPPQPLPGAHPHHPGHPGEEREAGPIARASGPPLLSSRPKRESPNRTERTAPTARDRGRAASMRTPQPHPAPRPLLPPRPGVPNTQLSFRRSAYAPPATAGSAPCRLSSACRLRPSRGGRGPAQPGTPRAACGLPRGWEMNRRRGIAPPRERFRRAGADRSAAPDHEWGPLRDRPGGCGLKCPSPAATRCCRGILGAGGREVRAAIAGPRTGTSVCAASG